MINKKFYYLIFYLATLENAPKFKMLSIVNFTGLWLALTNFINIALVQ